MISGTLGGGNHAGAIANSGTLFFDQTADQTLTGVISGTGNIEKRGSGTLILAADNTFTGTLSLIGGTLVCQNFNTLATGGTSTQNTTIAGTGLVVESGDFTVAGKIQPVTLSGDGGTLTFGATSGNVTLAAGSEFIVNLDGATHTAGKIVTQGNIHIDPGALLSLAQIKGADQIQEIDEFVILSAVGGTITGSFSQTNYTIGGRTFELSGPVSDGFGGTQLRLRTPRGGGGGGGSGTYATPVVPEPSTYALCGGLGALALTLWRRRHRNSNHNKNRAS